MGADSNLGVDGLAIIVNGALVGSTPRLHILRSESLSRAMRAWNWSDDVARVYPDMLMS